MQILDPYTIVWVVKKQDKLTLFSGPYFISSAKTFPRNHGDMILYDLEVDHNIYSCYTNPENAIKEARDTEVFTEYDKAMEAFTNFHCDDIESITKCVADASRYYREGKEKQNKKVCVPQYEEEGNSIEDFKK